MPTPYKEKNLAALKEKHPHLYDLYHTLPDETPGVEVKESKTALPVFTYNDAPIHSLYKPEEEGTKLAAALPPDIENLWVFGLGYGYHLRGLLERPGRLTVVEPSEAIFKSAVDNADLHDILHRCELSVGLFYNHVYTADAKNAALAPHRPYQRFFGHEFARLETSLLVRGFLQEKPLKIMLAGPIYGGSETTFRYAKTALENLGAEVVPFDPTPFAQGFHKLEEFAGNELHLNQLRGLFTGMLGESALAFADKQRPDLVLAMAQAPLSENVIENLKKVGAPVAFWFVEDFRTLGYWEQVAKHYDYFFTIQRGEFFEKLQQAGAKHVAYVPQAAAPQAHRPLNLPEGDRQRYGSDLSFMGAGYKNRHELFKGLMDYDFKLWGTEWSEHHSVFKLMPEGNRRLSPEEYIKIFNASKINLNLHSSRFMSGIDPVGDFVNPRVFEIASCGAFQLVDKRSELEPLFTVGEEVETFGSIAELREKADHYLHNEDERLAMAARARRRVLKDHTFERRMEDILRTVMETQDDDFGTNSRKVTGNQRNIVKNILAEAEDLPELQKFLRGFDKEKPLSIKEVDDKITAGQGKLTRVESIFQMIRELTVQ